MPALNPTWWLTPVNRTPYPWLATPPGQLLDEDTASHLAATFPTDAFVRHDTSGRAEGKSYRNHSLELVTRDGVRDAAARLPSGWRALLDDVVGKPYRAAVATLFAQPVAAALEVRLVRHGAEDWLSPHTDRADKLFSHVIYFNPDWREEWGGCLEILEGDDREAVAGRVVPTLGSSVLLARSERSWHQVTPVRADAARDRMSFLIHGIA